MRNWGAQLVAGLIAIVAGIGAAGAATLTVACGPASGARFEFCKQSAQTWAHRTGHTVQFLSTPASTTDTLSVYRQIFAARSRDLDVLMLDVVWPGLLKDHLLPLEPYAGGVARDHFSAIIANNTVDGKLLALPWYADAGLLYYRKDLLEKYNLPVPQTWEEFARSASLVQRGERGQGHPHFEGFVFQGKAYEGLSCNALEWIASFRGGNVIAGDGRITVNNPHTIEALATARSWIGTIAPAGVLNYAEEDARGVFQNGNALFMRNWSYAWKPMQAADSPVRGKVGVTLLPRGGAVGMQTATLGGRQLAVSRYSTQAQLAADLVLAMTSAQAQTDAFLRGAFLPTRPALYDDNAVRAAHPYIDTLYQAFKFATPRPSSVTGLKYPAVSNALWDAVHEVLTGRNSANDGVKKLQGKLVQIRRRGW